jgi:hypothetical protein
MNLRKEAKRMHKIGIISDTHGLLRPEVLEALQDCECIIHGGDINKRTVLNELEKIAPVSAVRGNNDKAWAVDLPEHLEIERFGVHFFVVHNKKQIPKNLGETQCVIYGHSHKYEEKQIDGVFYLNPGSCGPRRFHQDITMAVMTVEEDGTFQVQRIDIPHEPDKKEKGNNL